MENAVIERQLALGHRHLERGLLRAAMEAFRVVLTHDPDHAEAHACLALALHDARRLHAAEVEARLAIAADPESALAHLAMAWVSHSARNWTAARAHGDQARALAPHDATVTLALARLHYGMGDIASARRFAETTLGFSPDDVSAHVLLGKIALHHDRDVDKGLSWALDALAIEPDDPHAIVLRGEIALRQGDVDEAREHALFALSSAPNDRAALALLVATKARRSMFLGLWWRFNAWFVGRDDGGTSMLLLVMFALQALLQLILRDAGFEQLSTLVLVLWIGFCAYTWVGPAWFQRTLEKELRSVRLRDDF